MEGVSLLAARELLVAALNVLRLKVIVVGVGSAGLGIVAQTMALRNVLSQCASLSYGSGATRLSARYFSEGRLRELSQLMSFLRRAALLSSLVLMVAATATKSILADWVFADASLWPYVLVVVAALPLGAAGDIAVQLLRGARRFDAVLTAGLASAVAGLLATAAMVAFFGLHGAVGSLLVAAALRYLVHSRAVRKSLTRPLGLSFEGLPPTATLRLLAGFGAGQAVGALSAQLALLIARSWVVSRQGASANGEYELAVALTRQIDLVLVWPILSYVFATVSGNPDRQRAVLSLGIRAFLLIAVPVVTLVAVSPESWIAPLFSSALLGAASLVRCEAGTWLSRGVLSLLGASLWSAGRVRAATVVSVLRAGAFLFFFFALAPHLSTGAIPVAQHASFVLAFVVLLIDLKTKGESPFEPGWKRLLWSSMAVGVIVASSALLEGWNATALVLGCSAAWACINLRPTELRVAWLLLRPLLQAKLEAARKPGGGRQS